MSSDTPPQPTPTVAPADATFSAPAGTAVPPPPLGVSPSGFAAQPAVDPNPEKLVGAAFAGGLVFALLLKRMSR